MRAPPAASGSGGETAAPPGMGGPDVHVPDDEIASGNVGGGLTSPTNVPSFCAGGCGFFASVAPGSVCFKSFYCSVCVKKTQRTDGKERQEDEEEKNIDDEDAAFSRVLASSPTLHGEHAAPGSDAAEITAAYIGGVYTGTVRNGKPNGQGTLTWKDGDRYDGAWLDGEISGHGTYSWPAEGEKYDGAWVDGEMSGHGVYTWSNGNRYTGAWLDGDMSGHGTYTWSDGNTYEGAWLDDKIGAYGTFTWADGRKYEGRVQDLCTESGGSAQGAAGGGDAAEEDTLGVVLSEETRTAMQGAAAREASRRSRVFHAHSRWIRKCVRSADAPPHIAEAWTCLHQYQLATWDEYVTRAGGSGRRWLDDMVLEGSSPSEVSDAYHAIAAYKKKTYHPPSPACFLPPYFP